MAKGKNDFNYMVITGRRWFQKSYGNTYHSVSIQIVTDKGTHNLSSDIHYGYDDQYRQTAFDLLKKNGWFADFEDYNRFEQYRRANNDKFIFTVLDVSRQKDL